MPTEITMNDVASASPIPDMAVAPSTVVRISTATETSMQTLWGGGYL